MEGKISDFLKRYLNIRPPDDTVRAMTVSSVEKITGVKIDKKDISFSHGAVRIFANPHIKNKIFMKKEAILFEMKKHLEKDTPKEIL